MSPNSESFLNTKATSAHHRFQLDCMNTFSVNCRNPPFWPIFCRFFLAPRGPKLSQRRQKANQICTLTRQMHIRNLKMIFQIIISGTPDGRRDAHHSYVPSRLRRRGLLIQQQAWQGRAIKVAITCIHYQLRHPFTKPTKISLISIKMDN